MGTCPGERVQCINNIDININTDTRGGSTDKTNGDVRAIVQGLRRMVKALYAYSQGVREAYGATGPDVWTLKALQGRGRMSTRDLAAALAVDPHSTTMLVDRLMKRGLVRPLRRRVDRRFGGIELTRRGAALASDAPQPAQDRLLSALEAMSPDELQNVRHVVERLVRGMEASDVNAHFFFVDP